MRGEGRLYREPGSRYWWCAYYVHGKEVRQSTRETDERRAKRVLRRHMADVLRGECIPHEHRVTLGDLVAMVRADYDVHQRRSRTTVTYPLKHLTAQLGAETPALALTSDRLDQYILDRRAEGASNASIRIELAMLSKGFTLAVRARKLRIKPYIPKPEGDPSRLREGFFTREDVDRLCTPCACPPGTRRGPATHRVDRPGGRAVEPKRAASSGFAGICRASLRSNLRHRWRRRAGVLRPPDEPGTGASPRQQRWWNHSPCHKPMRSTIPVPTR